MQIHFKLARSIKKTQGQCTVEISSHNIAQLFGQTGEMAECSLEKYVVAGWSPVAVTIFLDHNF